MASTRIVIGIVVTAASSLVALAACSGSTTTTVSSTAIVAASRPSQLSWATDCGSSGALAFGSVPGFVASRMPPAMRCATAESIPTARHRRSSVANSSGSTLPSAVTRLLRL